MNHGILLEIISELGTCTTGDVIRKLGNFRDKRIYSALDMYSRNGYVTKTQPSGKSKNVWNITQDGLQEIARVVSDGGMFTVIDYINELKDYRKKNPSKKQKKPKSPQKDLLEAPKKPVKVKEPEEDIGLMGAAATAAVDGIAALVEENQRNTALLDTVEKLLAKNRGSRQLK